MQPCVSNVSFRSHCLPITLDVGNSPRSVILTDLDGDGRTDIAVANQAQGSITVFYR
jgi:hypothetical protein